MAKCDVFQCNKGETVKDPDTLQPLPIPPSIWRDISMDFIVGLPKSRINQSSWWSLVVFPSMLISVLFNTHLSPPLWLKFSWIKSSSFMECLILLFLIETPLSPVIFGKKCSCYRAPNCILAQLIIPRLMVKLKLSTSVWKHN
jgi:hypothetical protein